MGKKARRGLLGGKGLPRLLRENNQCQAMCWVHIKGCCSSAELRSDEVGWRPLIGQQAWWDPDDIFLSDSTISIART